MEDADCPGTSGEERCQFVYQRRTNNFTKGDKCMNQCKAGSIYCNLHARNEGRGQSRKEKRAIPETRVKEREKAKNAMQKRRKIEGVRSSENEAAAIRRSKEEVQLAENEAARIRMEERRTNEDVRLADNEAARIRMEKRRMDEDVRIEINEANRIGMAKKRADEHYRITEQEADRRRKAEQRCLQQIHNDEETMAQQEQWPKIPSEQTQWNCINEFSKAMSIENNVLLACCVCNELQSKDKLLMRSKVELLKHKDLLRRTDGMTAGAFCLAKSGDTDCIRNELEDLDDMILQREGLVFSEDGQQMTCMVCNSCWNALEKSKVPRSALVNDLHPGNVPSELQNMSLLEEQFIALYRCRVHIVSLISHVRDPDSKQRAIRGNCITFAQNPGAAYRKLPPPIGDVASNVIVVFTSCTQPTEEDIRKSAWLTVNREKVRKALTWLIANNEDYANVELDEHNLSSLPENGLPQRIFDMVQFRKRRKAAKRNVESESKDKSDSDSDTDLNDEEDDEEEEEEKAEMTSSGVIDVNAIGAGTEHLKSSVMKELEDAGNENRYLHLYPHQSRPVVEFGNLNMIAGIYPTLFPYGCATFDSQRRKIRLSFEFQLRHFLKSVDRRFAQHESFIFVCFNVMQRYKACMQARMIMKRPYFASAASNINTISKEEVKRILQEQDRKDPTNVRELNQQIKVLGMNIPGSVFSKISRRNEIRGLIIKCGIPSLFITINPSDIHSTILLQFAGYEVSYDISALNERYPVKQRARIVAENPVAACQFFDKLLTSTIKYIFGWNNRNSPEGGVFGKISAYYGIIESQMRGSLHWHGILWLTGALSPDDMHKKLLEPEFEARVVRYLDTIIKSEYPVMDFGRFTNRQEEDDGDAMGEQEEGNGRQALAPHPALMRCPEAPRSMEMSDDDIKEYCTRCLVDLNNVLARNGQIHKCTETCKKYSSKECRFRFPAVLVVKTGYEREERQLYLNRSHPMVNQFNSILTSCVRCNTDVKFLGLSKNGVLALVYYVTNYITKAGVKFTNGDEIRKAILTKAAGASGSMCKCEDGKLCSCDAKDKARSMILRCFIATSGNQQISAPQVAALILGIGRNGEYYSSHTFEVLHYGSVMTYLRRERSCMEQEDAEPLAGTSKEDEETDGNNDQMEEEEFEQCMLEEGEDGTFTLTNALMDYVHRGTELESVCLYDFKSKYVKRRSKGGTEAGGTEMNEEEQFALDCFGLEIETEEGDDDGGGASYRKEKNGATKKGNKYRFLSGHPQWKTHVMAERKDPIVPVLLGPKIPTLYSSSNLEDCALIRLLLFKAWRERTDLKQSSETWWKSFQKWYDLAKVEQTVRIEIDNLELLHKAKEEAAEEAIRRSEEGDDNNDEQSTRRRADFSDFVGFDENRDDEHLITIEDLMCPGDTDWNAENDCEITSEYVASAIDHLGNMGIFDVCREENECTDQHSSGVSEVAEQQFGGKLQKWIGELERQRELKLLENQPQICNQEDQPSTSSNNENGLEMSDGEVLEPSLQAMRNLDDIARQDNLNAKQTMLFKIVAEHLDTLLRNKSKPEQLLLIVLGEAGTGKTHALKAIKSYFTLMNQRHLLRVVAPTGSASLNLEGSTVHSLINLNPAQGKSGEIDQNMSKNARIALETQLKNCEYLMIDEFSMCGQRLFGETNEAFVIAKSSDSNAPFGGANVILCGDLLQFDPVADKPIYCFEAKKAAAPKSGSTSKSDASRNTRTKSDIGYAVYYEYFKNVIILTEQCRQSDPVLHGLLKNIREGKWNKCDCDIIRKRLLEKQVEIWKDAWRRLTFIVSRNELRTELNRKMIKKFAFEKREEKKIVHAIDTYKSKKIEGLFANVLAKLEDGKTERLIHRLELCRGCPIILTHNMYTEIGLVNGAMGTFEQLVYDPSIKGPIPYYCIVKLESFTGKCSDLPEKYVPIPPTTRRFQANVLNGDRKVTVHRTQIPIALAFSITDFRSQGKTLRDICIDLQPGVGKTSQASPYVMLSRAKSLNEVFVLRPFPEKVFEIPHGRKLKAEMVRLEILADETEEVYARGKLTGLLERARRNRLQILDA